MGFLTLSIYSSLEQCLKVLGVFDIVFWHLLILIIRITLGISQNISFDDFFELQNLCSNSFEIKISQIYSLTSLLPV